MADLDRVGAETNTRRYETEQGRRLGCEEVAYRIGDGPLDVSIWFELQPIGFSGGAAVNKYGQLTSVQRQKSGKYLVNLNVLNTSTSVSVRALIDTEGYLEPAGEKLTVQQRPVTRGYLLDVVDLNLSESKSSGISRSSKSQAA